MTLNLYELRENPQTLVLVYALCHSHVIHEYIIRISYPFIRYFHLLNGLSSSNTQQYSWHYMKKMIKS